MNNTSSAPESPVANNNPVLPVTDDTFEAEVLQSTQPVFVDFWAPWCGPCRMVAPMVEELAREYAGRIKFMKLNTDENQGIAGAIGIQSIPTLAVFQGNKVLDYRIGGVPRDDLRRMLDGVLAQPQASTEGTKA